MTTKIYSTFLLTASISLVGCQTTKIVPPKTTLQDRPIMLMKADIPDSDEDGVLDNMDACPGTPINIVVDAQGCPTPVEVSGHDVPEFRAYFPENSNESKNLCSLQEWIY